MSKSASSSQSVSNSQNVANSVDECLDDQNQGHEDKQESVDDDAPHRDPEKLERAFERFGTLDKTATYFDVSSTTVRKYLRKYELYTSEYKIEDAGFSIRPYNLENMSPEDVGLPPIGERRD